MPFVFKPLNEQKLIDPIKYQQGCWYIYIHAFLFKCKLIHPFRKPIVTVAIKFLNGVDTKDRSLQCIRSNHFKLPFL